MKTKHTKGQYKAQQAFMQDGIWQCNIESTAESLKPAMTRAYTIADAEFNARLIAYAFNTTTECGLLPPELLEQRNELLEMLKEIRQWYEQNHKEYLGEYTPICFSKALSIIKKATK